MLVWEDIYFLFCFGFFLWVGRSLLDFLFSFQYMVLSPAYDVAVLVFHVLRTKCSLIAWSQFMLHHRQTAKSGGTHYAASQQEESQMSFIIVT